MIFLLDTHVWIWSQEAPEKLGRRTTRLLTDRRNALYVSTVSTLEIARLARDGIIEIAGSIDSWVSETLESLSCDTIQISHEIAIGAYSLPGVHKDPADRLLVATARIHELTLVTADDRLLRCPHVRSQDARI